MDIDTERVDESILALLALFAVEKTRSWKSYNWEAMERLHAKGLIENPVSKSLSVHLSAEGLAKGREAAQRLFGASGGKRP